MGTLTVDNLNVNSNITGGGADNLKLNNPSFFAYVKTQHNLSDQAFVKVQFDEEEYDASSVYDKATNYRFTCAEAGRYFLSTHCMVRNAANNYYQQNVSVAFYKNGSEHCRASNKHEAPSGTGDGLGYYDGCNNTVVLDLAVNDYIEVYCYVNVTSSTAYIFESDETSTPKKHRSFFMGFKIGD
tara:strand:- start:36 stop:587 length:552 start_codon:yes stop_codon:yes gene_type:complete